MDECAWLGCEHLFSSNSKMVWTGRHFFSVDSGGQYLDGTTDITRTFHYGEPEPEIIDSYTRVLMGAIDLARVVMPVGTLETAIDYVTRQHLFSQGRDYG